MKKNIVLIGMPGSGKSTIGVLLAKALGMPFIDTDLIIQQKNGKLLQEIIDSEGLERFLEIEEQVVLDLDVEEYVIATGGSVIYKEKGMQSLKRNGLMVYLELEYAEIESRIKNMKTRGIAMQKGYTLLRLYNERIPLYKKYADIVVNCSGKGIEETVEAIVNALHK